MDKKKIERAVRMILEAIGEDPDRQGLKETPARVFRMYEEIFSGKRKDAAKELSAVFLEKHKEMILSKDIQFYSMCEHHMLPFFGKVHVAYIPNKKVVGISKLARVVEAFARRLQVQERLTSQIADLIDETLSPSGVAVVIDATHTCMTMRGVQKSGTRIITSAMRGVFRSKVASRAEVMSLINSR